MYEQQPRSENTPEARCPRNQAQPIQVLLRRSAEIQALADHVGEALAIVTDLKKLNDLMLKANRPDLALNEPAEQLQLERLEDFTLTNNFAPNLVGFAYPLFIVVDEALNRAMAKRPMTQDELNTFIQLGGRSYKDYIKLSQEAKIPLEVAEDLAGNSHILQPAFIRMLIALPELTQSLFHKLLSSDYRRGSYREELFAAYTIMSKLVDRNDNFVKDEDGTIDISSLCR